MARPGLVFSQMRRRGLGPHEAALEAFRLIRDVTGKPPRFDSWGR